MIIKDQSYSDRFSKPKSFLHARPPASKFQLQAANQPLIFRLCKMQKIIRRTQYAIAQAERRKLRRRAIDIRDKWSNKNANADAGKREHIKALKKARLEQKEDWELGPLAPRRDVGDKKDTYGTVHPFSIDDAANIPESEREAGRERFGGKYYCSVKEGDRVVVLAGRDKGTISKVLEVNAKKGAVKVQGVDLVRISPSSLPSPHFDIIHRSMLPSPSGCKPISPRTNGEPHKPWKD